MVRCSDFCGAPARRPNPSSDDGSIAICPERHSQGLSRPADLRVGIGSCGFRYVGAPVRRSRSAARDHWVWRNSAWMRCIGCRSTSSRKRVAENGGGRRLACARRRSSSRFRQTKSRMPDTGPLSSRAQRGTFPAALKAPRYARGDSCDSPFSDSRYALTMSCAVRGASGTPCVGRASRANRERTSRNFAMTVGLVRRKNVLIFAFDFERRYLGVVGVLTRELVEHLPRHSGCRARDPT